MAKSSAVNLDITPNADGYSIAGGTTSRTLTLTAGNVTLSAGGSNTYTMPSATDTLVGRASTDTLTNKLLSTGTTFSNGIVPSTALAESYVRGRFQSITTNTAPTGLTQQMGWSYIQGAGTNTGSKTITFPVAFSTIYSVHITQLGLTNGSAPTAITSFNTEYSGNVVVFIASDITTTTFNAAYCLDSSATLASTLYAGFSWIAYGTV